MRINEFFRVRLGAPLHNPRQSWGAHDATGNRVFLRIGDWTVSRGKRWALVYDPDWNPSSGHEERLTHIAAIRNGAAGYAVVVEYNDAGHIKAFDPFILLELGKRQKKQNGRIYLQVVGEHSIDLVVRGGATSDTVVNDIQEINSRPLTSTERRTLVAARIGQGLFRTQVLKLWGGACAVTGSTLLDAIRASHIKPWRDCTPHERLDRYNGLPLVGTLDALFDRGLIAVTREGKVQVSSSLTVSDRALLNLNRLRLRTAPPPKTKNYLSYHLERVFQP